MRLSHDDQMRQARLAVENCAAAEQFPAAVAMSVQLSRAMLDRARAVTPRTLVRVTPSTLRRFRQCAGGQRAFNLLAAELNGL